MPLDQLCEVRIATAQIQAYTRGWLTRCWSCQRWSSYVPYRPPPPKHLNQALMRLDRLSEVRIAVARIQVRARGRHAHSRGRLSNARPPGQGASPNPVLEPFVSVAQLIEERAVVVIQGYARGWRVRLRGLGGCQQWAAYEPYQPSPPHHLDLTSQLASTQLDGSQLDSMQLNSLQLDSTQLATSQPGGLLCGCEEPSLSHQWGHAAQSDLALS